MLFNLTHISGLASLLDNFFLIVHGLGVAWTSSLLGAGIFRSISLAPIPPSVVAPLRPSRVAKRNNC